MARAIRLLTALMTVLTSSASAEWTISGFIGGAHTQNSSLRIQGSRVNVEFDPVAWEGRAFSGPLYYGVRAGYFFTRRVGIEAEFIHLKVFARTGREVNTRGAIDDVPVNARMPLGNVVESFSISHGNNLLFGNIVLRHSLFGVGDELGRLLLIGRVGAGGSIPHPESRILGAPLEQYQWGGVAFQLAGGAELKLWRGLYLTGEYKFTHNRQRVDVADGTARTNLTSHHGVTGLTVHF